MKHNLESKVLPFVVKFTSTKTMVALRNGVTSVIPLTIIGSIFLIIASFPIPAFVTWLNDIGLRPILLQAFAATYNMLAIVVAFTIAYNYTKEEKIDGVNSGIISVVTFVLLMNHQVVNAEGVVFKSVLSMTWLGSRGMIGAILIAIFSAKVYCAFVKRGITIKMPASVPEGVSNSFIAIIPGAVIISTATVIYGILNMYGTTFLEIIYTTIQIPLQGLTSSFIGICLFAILVSFLWWFGIHGSNIMISIFQSITIANAAANQAIIDSGVPLTAENGFIFTENFRTTLIIITGSGITIGIVLYMVFFAKSTQMKEIGKLSIVPAIFNINEPIIFGTPVVLNPYLFIPFICAPLASTALGYILMKINILPLMGAILPPWTTPVFFSGFLAGGIKIAIYQIVVVIMSFAIYFPFMKKVDEDAYKLEMGNSGEEQ